MMSLIDRHVLGQWLKAFGLMLTALLGLLILVDMQHNLGDFTQSRAGFFEVFYYYAVLLPGNVPLVLQISVLLSLLYSLGQMHRNNEFTAMRTAGLGIFQITRSIWLCGGLLVVIVWYLNASLIPWSVEEARRVRERIIVSARAAHPGGEERGLVPAVGFVNPRGGRIWFFNRFNEITNRGYGVTLGLLDAKQREVRRLVAKEAFFDGERRTWVFLSGRELLFNPDGGELLRPRAFDRHVEPDVADDPALMLLYRKSPADLSRFELRRGLDDLAGGNEARSRRLAVEFERRRADPFGVLIVMALAVPFAISGVRVNPAVNISKSIGLFFAYFLLARLGALLGSFGTLDPITAAWLPDGAMLAVAAWFFLRLR